MSNEKVIQMSLLYIADNVMLFEFPHPMPSNVIMCGGLAVTSAIQLLYELNNFIHNSPGGVVVVSFGSKMPKAFNMEVKHMTNNLMLPWIPQNDLLGDPKTKLCITHSSYTLEFVRLYR